jgi:hypothetical protein
MVILLRLTILGDVPKNTGGVAQVKHPQAPRPYRRRLAHDAGILRGGLVLLEVLENVREAAVSIVRRAAGPCRARGEASTGIPTNESLKERMGRRPFGRANRGNRCCS